MIEDELSGVFAERAKESPQFLYWVLSRTKFAKFSGSVRLLHEDQLLRPRNLWWKDWWCETASRYYLSLASVRLTRYSYRRYAPTPAISRISNWWDRMSFRGAGKRQLWVARLSCNLVPPVHRDWHGKLSHQDLSNDGERNVTTIFL
jgi:hypothetical protein